MTVACSWCVAAGGASVAAAISCVHWLSEPSAALAYVHMPACAACISQVSLEQGVLVCAHASSVPWLCEPSEHT